MPIDDYFPPEHAGLVRIGRLLVQFDNGSANTLHSIVVTDSDDVSVVDSRKLREKDLQVEAERLRRLLEERGYRVEYSRSCL